MPATPAPADLGSLLREVIDSFEKLQILVRLDRETDLAVADATLIDGLGLKAPFGRDALNDLVHRGLVAGSAVTGWRLDRDSPWIAAVQELARLHASDLLLVLNLMTNAAMERLRGKAAHAFADAFVVRARKKGGDDA